MSRTHRLLGSTVAVVALTGAALVGPAAHAVQPTPDQASFKVKRAECGYAPIADKIKAWADIRVTVKKLPDAEAEYYTLGKINVQSRKPGTTTWTTFTQQGVTSTSFGADELPYGWNAKAAKPVPAAIADNHELSFRYVIKLMKSSGLTGDDTVVWKARGRTATVGCGDG
jgi:hypothetical protein